jgi:hypothetical protein
MGEMRNICKILVGIPQGENWLMHFIPPFFFFFFFTKFWLLDEFLLCDVGSWSYVSASITSKWDTLLTSIQSSLEYFGLALVLPTLPSRIATFYWYLPRSVSYTEWARKSDCFWNLKTSLPATRRFHTDSHRAQCCLEFSWHENVPVLIIFSTLP